MSPTPHPSHGSEIMTSWLANNCQQAQLQSESNKRSGYARWLGSIALGLESNTKQKIQQISKKYICIYFVFEDSLTAPIHRKPSDPNKVWQCDPPDWLAVFVCWILFLLIDICIKFVFCFNFVFVFAHIFSICIWDKLYCTDNQMIPTNKARQSDPPDWFVFVFISTVRCSIPPTTRIPSNPSHPIHL